MGVEMDVRLEFSIRHTCLRLLGSCAPDGRVVIGVGAGAGAVRMRTVGTGVDADQAKPGLAGAFVLGGFGFGLGLNGRRRHGLSSGRGQCRGDGGVCFRTRPVAASKENSRCLAGRSCCGCCSVTFARAWGRSCRPHSCGGSRIIAPAEPPRTDARRRRHRRRLCHGRVRRRWLSHRGLSKRRPCGRDHWLGGNDRCGGILSAPEPAWRHTGCGRQGCSRHAGCTCRRRGLVEAAPPPWSFAGAGSRP